MWRVVCVGPGPRERSRRMIDRGPLLPDEKRAISIAAYLRSTGLYESVKVEVSSASAALMDAPEISFQMGKQDAPSNKKSLDELSSLVDDSVSQSSVPPADAT